MLNVGVNKLRTLGDGGLLRMRIELKPDLPANDTFLQANTSFIPGATKAESGELV
jgi:hypothetical protein